MNSMIWENQDPFRKNQDPLIKNSYKSNEFGSFRMWQKHYQNKAIYWRETLKMSILEQSAEIVPSRLLAGFCCKLELFWASRRFSLLQTLCARRYEKRTQQAELVGKTTVKSNRPETVSHAYVVVYPKSGFGKIGRGCFAPTPNHQTISEIVFLPHCHGPG